MAIDFVVCLGGDGVILHASYLFRRAIPPVRLPAASMMHAVLTFLVSCSVLLAVP